MLYSTDIPKNLIYLVISRISSTNSGATTPQDIGNRSIENSDTEFEEYYRYESGHIALDYGTGKHGMISIGSDQIHVCIGCTNSQIPIFLRACHYN